MEFIYRSLLDRLRLARLGIVPQAKSIDAARSHLNALVRFLFILQPEPHRLVGLPIDFPPSIQSIQISAFQPLPDVDRQHGNIHCASSRSIELRDRPSIFLLDVDSLV